MKERFNDIEIQTTFQSRFGPQEWLTPYTDKTLETLPNRGVKNLLVICPGSHQIVLRLSKKSTFKEEIAF